MVIPRSLSRSILSRYWGVISRAETVPVSSRRRSAKVDFPWSIWAMMEKFRIIVWSLVGSIRIGKLNQFKGNVKMDILAGTFFLAAQLTYQQCLPFFS